MSRSGGLFYHIRALRFGGAQTDAIWSGHRLGVSKFLDAWNPPEKTLILIGPSGGYSLPLPFLERFERVIAVEPDFLARAIFEKRFSLKPDWVKSSVDLSQISDFLSKYPANSAILFSNLLGQIPFRNLKVIRRALDNALQNRTWASYHDALSGENLEFDTEGATPGKRATLSQMKSWVYPMIQSGTLTVNAHQSSDLFEQGANRFYHYWQWKILPKRTHLIEGVFHVKT